MLAFRMFQISLGQFGDGKGIRFQGFERLKKFRCDVNVFHGKTMKRLGVSNFATFYPVSIIETMKTSPYSPHYDTLRSWMKQKREERGLSLRAASERIGRHHSVLGKMEQDRRKIEILEFVTYCRGIGIDPHEGLDVVIKSIEAEAGRG